METATLGAFDPLALGLTFSCARFARAATAGAASMAAATSADAFHSVIETLSREVPAELLTHEMTHLYQITATGSGLREFADMHRYLTRCGEVIAAVAGRRGGQVPAGVLTHALPDEVRGLEESRNALLVQKGGVMFPMAALDPYRVRRSSGTIFEVRGVFGGGESVWCADLTGLGGPAATAVTLGNVHLFEGQALQAELLRGATSDVLNGAPPHPYQIARSIFLSFCPGRLAEAELVYVIDAALMADDGRAFHRFLRMCDALAAHPGLRLKGFAPAQVEAFQNGLLDGPVPDIAYPAVLAEIRRSSPLFAPMIGSWSHAFATMLRERARPEWGGGTAVALARMPHEHLVGMALDLMTTTLFQPVSLTDGAVPDRDVLSIASIPRIKPVLEEILYGAQPCSVRERCGLPERAACTGLPPLTAVHPEGERCMREYALVSVAESLGLRGIG